MEHGELTGEIINAAMKVHMTLGIGFLESIYQNALVVELTRRGFDVEREVDVPVYFEGVEVGRHRIDVMVEGIVVVELKATRGIDDIHVLTVKSYLAATNLKLALLINFGTPKLQVKRIYPTSEGSTPFG